MFRYLPNFLKGVESSNGPRDGSEFHVQATSPPSLEIGSPVPSIPITTRPTTPTSGQLSRPESPDEIMEISSDSSDEGEINDLDPETSPDQQLRRDSEMDDDEYEPQLETDILIQQMPDGDASIDVADHPSTETIAPNAMEVDQGNVDHAADTPLVDRSSVEEGELSRSMSADDPDDSDDYEPPEPVPIVDNRAVSDKPDAVSMTLPSSHKEEGQVLTESTTALAEQSTIVDLTGDLRTGSSDAPLENVRYISPCYYLTNIISAFEYCDCCEANRAFHPLRESPQNVPFVPVSPKVCFRYSWRISFLDLQSQHQSERAIMQVGTRWRHLQ